MIDIRKLKELVKLMVANDLTELDLRDTEEQVTLRRPAVGGVPTLVTHAAPATASASVATGAAVAEPPAEPDHDLVTIDSPMVGTFYAKPDPDADPFITIGSRVSTDTVVCLVEAMKIFNEIKAECSGTLHRVLAESGAPVEFGQPLFEIKPD